jgi:hypothetical protein
VFAAGHGLLAASDAFAIDAFDGDLAADVARVQPVSSDSSGANYIVQLQFGSAAPFPSSGEWGFAKTKCTGSHVSDQAFRLSAQFDLNPSSFACIPAWARPTRSALRPEPPFTKLTRANFIRRARSPEPESTFLTDFGFESLSHEVAEPDVLQAQIQIEVYHVSKESKAFDHEDLGLVFGDS